MKPPEIDQETDSCDVGAALSETTGHTAGAGCEGAADCMVPLAPPVMTVPSATDGRALRPGGFAYDSCIRRTIREYVDLVR